MREDTLLYPGLTCTLLCIKHIRKNGLHVEIHVDGKEELIYFTNLTGYGKQIYENSVPRIWIVLYIHKTYIFVAYKIISQNIYSFQAWHDSLSHPRVGMMRKIISNSIGLDLHKAKFPQSLDLYALHVLNQNK
jgi:hypothetical protein